LAWHLLLSLLTKTAAGLFTSDEQAGPGPEAL
jgi:hypothetical protein